MKLFNISPVSFALAMGAATASAETTLRYSNWLPATHPFMAEVIEPWIASVEDVTEGRVKIEVLPKVVGSVPTQFEVIRDGMADVALIVDGYSPGRFKVNSIIELPFTGNDAESMTIAYWRIYDKYLADIGEYENAIPVAKASTGPLLLATGSTPIVTVDDISGLKLRVPTAMVSKLLAALGGVAVNKPVSELYELISSGVVDGTITSAEVINSFKVAGSLGNAVTVPGGFGSAGISFIVNEERLQELSDADREAFWSVSGEVFSVQIAGIYSDLNRRGFADLEEVNATVHQVSPEMEAELKERLAGLEQDWIEQAKKAGLANAEAVLAEFRAEIKKVEGELATQ